MAPHSSALAWKIPWMQEPGRLWSMGSLRVGHDWATSLLLFTFTYWRRKWQPTPVFLPGESQGHAEAETPILWPPDAKSWLIWKILMLGKTEGRRSRGSMGSHTFRHDRSDLTCIHALENEMATHFSVLAWRIPGTEELGGLLSTGSHTVRQDQVCLCLEKTEPLTFLPAYIFKFSPC